LGCSMLKYLYLNESEIKNYHIDIIGRMNNLFGLSLKGCSSVSDYSIAALKNAPLLKTLEELNLSETMITHIGLQTVARMKSLRVLDISHCHGVKILSPLNTLKYLEVLRLGKLQINEEAITEALSIAHAAGVTTVLNPAPARDVPDVYYELVDYVTPNETEAEFFTGCYQAERSFEEWKALIIDAYRKKGARNVIITLGAEGALCAGEQDAFCVPAFPVKAVDTTAAGDSFNAAFCVGLAAGMPVAEAMRMGCAAGGLTASKEGSVPSLPDKNAVDAILQK